MLNKNLLWFAHGHIVEVMLRMYAAWLEGTTDADIHAIKQSMEKRPVARAAFLDSRTAISTVNAVSNRVAQTVIRPLESIVISAAYRPEPEIQLILSILCINHAQFPNGTPQRLGAMRTIGPEAAPRERRPWRSLLLNGTS